MALSPAVQKEPNAANNHMSLKVDPSPVKPQMRPQPQLTQLIAVLGDPEAEDQMLFITGLRVFLLFGFLMQTTNYPTVEALVTKQWSTH